MPKKKTTEKKAKPLSKKFQDKQLKAILSIMVLIAVAGLLAYYFATKPSTYRGLEYTETEQGSLKFYNVKVPAINPATGKIEGYYNMVLRNDPKDLEYINFTGRGRLLKNIVLSYYPPIASCSDTIIGQGEFVRDFNGNLNFDIKGATTDEQYASEHNITYATCEHSKNQTVIIIQNASLGGPTIIKETVDNCYVIDVNKCETLEAFERFMLEIAAVSIKQ